MRRLLFIAVRLALPLSLTAIAVPFKRDAGAYDQAAARRPPVPDPFGIESVRSVEQRSVPPVAISACASPLTLRALCPHPTFHLGTRSTLLQREDVMKVGGNS